MSYINTTVTNYGTEAEFIWAFIQSFTSADNRIKCNLETLDDIEALFAADYRGVSFNFTVADIYTITFKRTYDSTAGTSSQSYTVSYKCQNTLFSASTAAIFASALAFYNRNSERIWKYQIISNDKAMFIRFGAYNSTLPLTTETKCLIYSDTVNSVHFIANEINGTYYVGDNEVRCSKVKRLPYLKNMNDPTQIEVIKSIVIVDASSVQAVNLDGLWDASTNYAVNVPLKIGTEQCCFLDSNTVMKC